MCGSSALEPPARLIVLESDVAISAPDEITEQWLELKEAIAKAPIIYELDVVRTERIHKPRLVEKIAREGLSIDSENDPGAD